MNTLLLVTRSSYPGIIAFAKELSSKQSDFNPGKLIVMGGSYLSDEELRAIGLELESCYEVVELSKVQVSERVSNESKQATMLATFFMQRYTSTPGPWLIVDGPAEVIHSNPLSLLTHHYNANSAENAGRATTLGGGRVPIGPVVIGSNVKDIKTLRSVSGQDWRQRGRWVFNIRSWHQFTPEEYPFRISAAVESPAGSQYAEEAPDQEASPTRSSVDSPGEPRRSLPIVGPHSQNANIVTSVTGLGRIALHEVMEESDAGALVAKVASTQGKTPDQVYEERLDAEAKGEPVPGDASYIPPVSARPLPIVSAHPGAAIEDEEPPVVSEQPVIKTVADRPLPFVRVDPSAYDKISRDELMRQYLHRSGKRAHPKTKSDKLIEKLRGLDQKAALAGKQ